MHWHHPPRPPPPSPRTLYGPTRLCMVNPFILASTPRALDSLARLAGAFESERDEGARAEGGGVGGVGSGVGGGGGASDVSRRVPTVGRLAVRRAIASRLVPALRAFAPDLVLLSAGFDGGKDDAGNYRNVRPTTCGMNLLPEDFAWITRAVLAVARVTCPGRVVSVLEGGYGKWRADAVRAAHEDAAPRDPPLDLFDRANLVENCAAHLRALVDDGACRDDA
jgi:hypothetical protein